MNMPFHAPIKFLIKSMKEYFWVSENCSGQYSDLITRIGVLLMIKSTTKGMGSIPGGGQYLQ